MRVGRLGGQQQCATGKEPHLMLRQETVDSAHVSEPQVTNHCLAHTQMKSIVVFSIIHKAPSTIIKAASVSVLPLEKNHKNAKENQIVHFHKKLEL